MLKTFNYYDLILKKVTTKKYFYFSLDGISQNQTQNVEVGRAYNQHRVDTSFSWKIDHVTLNMSTCLLEFSFNKISTFLKVLQFDMSH